MAIESKEILSYLNITDVDSLDQFKAKFDPEFIKKDLLKDVKSDVFKEVYAAASGKLLGSIRSNIVATAKKFGAEFKPEEVDRDQKMEDFLEAGFTKVKGLYEGKLNDLQTKIGQPDEVAKQWEEKYKKLESKSTDQEKLLTNLQEKNKEIQTTFDTEKSGWQNQVKSIKLENIISKDYEKIKWNTAAKPLEKTGFFAEFEKNFKRDLDETGNLEIFTTKNERIPNPAKAGTWLNHLELIEMKAKEAGLWEENPHAQTKKQPVVIGIGQQNGNGQILPGQPIRKLSSKIKAR